MKESNIKAVLVRLSIRIFPNTRQDPEITDEVRLKKSLGIGAGKWVKHVFPEEAFKDIREIGGELRRTHYDLTLPWEEGYRLLPVKAHDAYENLFEEKRGAFFAQVEEFQRTYDDWIKKAREMHNGTFNKALYPAWPVMEKHFECNREFTPVPKAAHFLTGGLASDAVAEMKEQLEQHNQQRIQAAVKDTYNRLMKPVQDISEKLVGKKPIFRDSLIGNVKEVLALIPQLNLTNDPQLVALAEEIETKFANIDPDLLRDDKAVRSEATKAAKQLISRFGAIGKRRFA